MASFQWGVLPLLAMLIGLLYFPPSRDRTWRFLQSRTMTTLKLLHLPLLPTGFLVTLIGLAYAPAEGLWAYVVAAELFLGVPMIARWVSEPYIDPERPTRSHPSHQE